MTYSERSRGKTAKKTSLDILRDYQEIIEQR